jgi:hypothetical protein
VGEDFRACFAAATLPRIHNDLAQAPKPEPPLFLRIPGAEIGLIYATLLPRTWLKQGNTLFRDV